MPPDYDYLIAYKLPKNKNRDKTGEPAVLQKNHGLKYLSYEGLIHNDQEKVRIVKKGIFLAHRRIISGQPRQFAHISWNKTTENENKTRRTIEDMWKKTDFKIAIDEIKLYEIADEKVPDKFISREIVPEKPAVALEIALDNLKEGIKTENVPPLSLPESGDKSVIETVERSMPNAGESSSNENLRVSQFQTDKEIEFVPIQELILEAGGKTSGEYKPTP